ncbi:hypothetical protein C8R43DRAFT_561311 [Mycena crocata]|nr:hypothetical protein C8R43DRAFT_561311 [Mycena crocata]
MHDFYPRPTNPPYHRIPPQNEYVDVGEKSVLSATPTDGEVVAHKRRMSTLPARRFPQRKMQHQQMLEEEAAALRAIATDLRAARAAFGLPPVHITKRPPRSAEAHMDPMPVAVRIPQADRGTTPASEMNAFRRQQSARAAWAFRRRKMQRQLLLEEELADLRAEVAALRVHARL